MTSEQVERILEVVSKDPETQAVVRSVLEALPHRGDELKKLSAALELARAKCIVNPGFPAFYINAAQFFGDLRRVCWTLWRM